MKEYVGLLKVRIFLLDFLLAWYIMKTTSSPGQCSATGASPGRSATPTMKMGTCWRNTAPTDNSFTSYQYTVEARLEAVYTGNAYNRNLQMAAAYDGDGNRVYQVNYNPDRDEDFLRAGEVRIRTIEVLWLCTLQA